MKLPITTSRSSRLFPRRGAPFPILADSVAATLGHGSFRKDRMSIFLRKPWTIASLSALLTAASYADTIPLTLNGNSELNLWGAGSLTADANSGYGGFPGTGAWPSPIQSPTGGDAYLYKVDNQKDAAIGAGAGGPFPSGSGIYFGGFGTVVNTDGGTLGVVDATPLANLQTVTFQIQIGQAFGYDLLNNNLSLVTLKYTTATGSGTLSSNFSSLLNRFYNGSVDMPTGPDGAMQPQDIYVNLWGLQWDLSTIPGITSFEIQFTGVEHASLTQLQLDQSSAAYASSAFPQDALWIAGGPNAKWSTLTNWSGGVAPDAGKNITLNGGTSAIVDTNQTVGTLNLNSASDFVVSNSDGAVLTVTTGINGTSASPARYTIAAPVHMPGYNLLDLATGNDLTLSGPITGAGFYKQGSGSLTLSGNNVYDGNNSQLANNGLIIRGGTNYISGTNTLTGTGNVDFNIRQDTTVVLHRGDNVLDSKFVVNLPTATSKLVLGDGAGKSDLTVAGLAGNVGGSLVAGSTDFSRLTVNVASGVREFSGNLGGAGANENNLIFIKKGAGTQVFSGTNIHAGATRIEGGMLQIGSATALSPNSNLQLDGGVLGLGGDNLSATLGTSPGQLQFTGDGGFAAVGTARTVTLNGNAALAWGSGNFVGNGSQLVLAHTAADNTVDITNAIDLGAQTRTVRVNNGSGNIDARLSGILSGTGTLVKTGVGIMELTAANTYTGGTIVREGNLTLSGASGSITGDVTVAAGATLQLINTATANNTNRIADTAKVTLNGAVLSFSTPTSGTTPAYSETIGELKLASGNNVISTFRAASGNSSILTLGTLTRETGATVNFGSSTTIGLDSRNQIVVNSGLNSFVGGWATAGNTFAAYGANGIWVPSTSSAFYTTTGETTWTMASNVFSNYGSGTVTLSGNRSVNSILTQGNSNGVKLWDLNGRTLNVQSGGILAYTGSSSNPVRFNNGTLTAGTGNDAELFATANGYLDIGATIANNGEGKVALVKAGTSTLTLSGTNTYTGGTYVNQGTLNVNGTNSGGGSLKVSIGAALNVNGSLTVSNEFVANGNVGGTGTIVFEPGTTLTGVGTVNQPLAIGTGLGQLSTISPGNSSGQLNTGSETWAGGGSYLWEIRDANAGLGFGWDFLNINGTLNITATEGSPFVIELATLTASNVFGSIADFDPGTSYSWTIATASGGITGFDTTAFTIDTTGFANELAPGGSFSVSKEGNSLAVTYAVPEPSAGLLLSGAGLWMLGLRRRRSIPRCKSSLSITSRDFGDSGRSHGFTLIELLVVISIIAILAGILFAVIGRVRESGNQAQEINAGRQLIAAYLAAAADRNGELMVAHYEGRAPDLDNSGLKLPNGRSPTPAELHRYPFRLAPYLGNEFNGMFLAGANRKQVERKFLGEQFYYGISLCPSFGINYYFVGGLNVDGEIQGEAECATRLSQVEKPSMLIVFATAFCEVEGERIAGRFAIEPPNYRTKLWDSSLHVDARYGDKALCVFLDGSVRSHTIEELRDMRYWSKNAVLADNPNYKVEVSGNSGIGGGGRR